ncbi:MAG: hypothetical protein N2037_08430 [Acidimicrobiales bacterium]|nr:hypothetical protein [Acidimicrobiales bacterium]
MRQTEARAGTQRPSPRRRVLVPGPVAFPVIDGVRPRPRWFIRLRGLLAMSLLVAITGILVALAVAAVLILTVAAVVSSLD